MAGGRSDAQSLASVAFSLLLKKLRQKAADLTEEDRQNVDKLLCLSFCMLESVPSWKKRFNRIHCFCETDNYFPKKD